MDREKVIEGIEAIREFFGFGLPSQSPVFEAYQRILTDAIALLKEQEAVAPRTENDEAPGDIASWWYVCGNCDCVIDPGDDYCRHCGRAVNWND